MIKRIIVIGNSHAHSFTGSRLSNFGRGEKSTNFLSSYSLGPLSAKSLAKSKWNLAEKFLIPMKEPSSILVILSLGENDCRWYIPEESDKGSKKFDVDFALHVSDLYLADLLSVMARIQSLGFQVAGWAGHPTPNLPHDEEKVIYGAYDYRAKISSHWVTELSKHCNREGFYFLSPMYELLNHSGFPNEQFYVDEWHLNPKWLSRFLIRSLIDLKIVGRFSFFEFQIQRWGGWIFLSLRKIYRRLRLYLSK